jgi:chorismate synthase
MPGNSFGELFRISTFGESHGPAIGVVIDGCPSGLKVTEALIQKDLDRRRPGNSPVATSRNESDRVEILSGVFENRTLGSPVTLMIRNQDAQPADYAHLKSAYRPSHADFTYEVKYGIRDYRGGGRSSARETAARVAAASIAKVLLRKARIEIMAYVSQIGNVRLEKPYTELDLSQVYQNNLRCPDAATARKMLAHLSKVREQGDTLGGIISCVIRNCPVGLGEPVFDKLHADLAKATMSINAAKGFEIGSGFSAASMKGSEHNDPFQPISRARKGRAKVFRTVTNNSGGIQGGISNGMDIHFRIAFKPVATLMMDQTSLDRQGRSVRLKAKGRHDPCVVPRAVPIVEAMAALVLADHLLRARNTRA